MSDDIDLLDDDPDLDIAPLTDEELLISKYKLDKSKIGLTPERYIPPEQPRVLNMAFGCHNSPNICWVCGAKSGLEEHHMIPRAYGGQDGPTITLCAICHANVHKLAEHKQPMEVKSVVNIAKTNNKKSLTRLQSLAIIIIQSKKVVQKDPNKTAVYMDRFEAKTRKQLSDLAKVLQLNQKQVVRLAISQLHSKYFKPL